MKKFTQVPTPTLRADATEPDIKKTQMNRQLLLQYRKQWAAVENVNKMRSRQATIETSWKEMNAIENLARSMELTTRPRLGIEEVRARWVTLRARAKKVTGPRAS